jgi:hypothetical protein
MLKTIQKKVENLRIKVYGGQSLEDNEKALYEIEQMLFKAMDKKLILPIVMCSVAHCKKDKHDVYIGRPSKWGNPFTHKKDSKTLAKHVVNSREEAVEAYRKWITEGEGKHLLKDLKELNGKILGCWCSPLSCHGDVLADLVNKQHYT